MNGDSQARGDLERVLDLEVRPGLSAHAGSIEVSAVDDSRVDLEFVGSCRSCYFRISCAVNLIEPTVRAAMGDRVDLHIGGVSHLRLNPGAPRPRAGTGPAR